MKINIGSKGGINNFGSIVGRQVGTPGGFNNFDSLIGEQVLRRKPSKPKKSPSWDSNAALAEVDAQIEAELEKIRGAAK